MLSIIGDLYAGDDWLIDIEIDFGSAVASVLGDTANLIVKTAKTIADANATISVVADSVVLSVNPQTGKNSIVNFTFTVPNSSTDITPQEYNFGVKWDTSTSKRFTVHDEDLDVLRPSNDAGS